MRPRLNEWQWIGIVLSVLWLVVAFFLERHVVYDPIYASYDHCVDRVLDDWSVCDKSMDEALVEARKAEPISFAGIALVPIFPFSAAVIARIRRGFRSAA
jgi:hypothetical protein